MNDGSNDKANTEFGAAFFEQIVASRARVFGSHLGLTLLVYGVVLGGPLLFDDHQFITWNEHVKNFDTTEIYTSSVTEGVGFQSNTYRPNQQFVFAAIHQFFGTSPYPYHAVSLGVHVANGFMLFLLFRALGFAAVGSLLASWIFLLHPVQTQAVSYASGLAGPLGLAFVLGALHAWLASLSAPGGRQRIGWYVVALALAIEALLTKSNMVIVFPLAVVLAIYLVSTGRRSRDGFLIGGVAGFAVLAFGYFAIKLTWLNFANTVGMVEGYNVYTESLWVRLYTFVSVLDRYFELLVWPWTLSYTKPKVIYSSIFTLHGALGVVIVCAGLAAAVMAKRWPIYFLACGWFFAALAPFSGVIPLPSMYLEHWLYAPMGGVAIGLAGFYDKASPEVRNRIAMGLTIVLVLFALRTGARNLDWADPERFYVADMRAAGYSVQMLNNLAIYQMSIDKDDAAIETLEFLIENVDTSPEPHDNLARVYLKKGDLSKARAEFLRALEIDPENRNSLMGLRGIYDRQGRHDESLEIDQRIRAIERDEGL
ncbi:MAG: tetratricopeptide repeat protein [Myxococcota bacterium]|jgi:hypothetical protein|nr:tetratricopeptide repeat protein [Myxococcota bacterium]